MQNFDRTYNILVDYSLAVTEQKDSYRRFKTQNYFLNTAPYDEHVLLKNT